MSLRTLGNRYIQPSKGRITVIKDRNATIPDIIDRILFSDCEDSATVARFAHLLRKGSEYETLRNIWQFTRKHIRYVRDNKKDHRNQHVEAVKSPAATWRDKYADCKGMSLLNGAIMKNLGFEYKYRVAFYDQHQPDQGHIYPIAVLPDGTEVIVDSVSAKFDYEEPFLEATDYVPQCKISGIHGPPAPTNKHKLLDGLLLVAFFLIAFR